MPVNIGTYLTQIAASKPQTPSPIRNALQALSNWANGNIVDADIKADAAIAYSKLAISTARNYAFKAHLGTEQSDLTSGLFYKVLIDTEEYDVGSAFSTVTSIFTCPVNGVYVFAGQVQWRSASLVAEKSYYAAIHDNTNTVILAMASDSVGATANCLLNVCTGPISLAAGTQIYLKVLSGAGVNTVDIDDGLNETWFAGALLIAT